MKSYILALKQYRRPISALAVFIVAAIVYFILPHDLPLIQKQMTLVFIFAASFWALEIIPLFATSLIIVLLLTTIFSIFNFNGGNQIGFTHFLTSFSNPIIMLFFGGFILAAAIHKHEIDKYLIEKMITYIGNRSIAILCGYIVISAIFSLWMSNTAATALMLLLARPILIHLHPKDPLRKGLIMGVGFGANLGGIGSPIGTPPNAIAIGVLAERNIFIDFIGWMKLTTPVIAVILVVIAAVLIFLFPPKSKRLNFPPLKRLRLSKKAWGVVAVSALVIGLWLTTPLHNIPEAITALLGISLFASFGLIGSDDLRHVHWDILILMWGGLALGQGMQMSGLIAKIVSHSFFLREGVMLIIIFSLLSVVLSTFMSNTAAANILLPITASFPYPVNLILTLIIALSCSFAFALPISTPTNALAYSTGVFSLKEMGKAGAIVSIFSIAIILLTYFVFYRHMF